MIKWKKQKMADRSVIYFEGVVCAVLSGDSLCAAGSPEWPLLINIIIDSDIWETIASCFQFRLMNHWTEDTESVWRTQLVIMVKKKNGKFTMRGFRQIAMLPTNYRLYSKTLQQLLGGALQSRRGPQYGHVPGRQAHEVVWMLRREWWNKVWNGKFLSSWLRRLITSHITESSRQR